MTRQQVVNLVLVLLLFFYLFYFIILVSFVSEFVDQHNTLDLACRDLL